MKIQKTVSILNRFPIELSIWVSGLVLAWFTAEGMFGDISMCPLQNLGVEHCPGCGLGTAVGYLLHGQIAMSFHTHPLGAVALGVLLFRIVMLLKYQISLFNTYKSKSNGTGN